MRLLVVEDELEMRDLLATGLQEHGYTVVTVSTGEAAMEQVVQQRFDAMILDVRLPKMTGNDVTARLRSQKSAVPILMLTACNTESDIVTSLDNGADDYMTKPFSFAEMIARINALSGRTVAGTQETLVVGPLVLELNGYRVYRDGEPIDLTLTELRLLITLMRSSGQPVSREELIRVLSKEDPPVSDGALDTFIYLLRKKVDGPFDDRLIHTVKRVGYTIRSAR